MKFALFFWLLGGCYLLNAQTIKKLHFDGLGAGTRVENQFASQGVRFLSDYQASGSYRTSPQITASGSARTSPNVLVNTAGSELFNSSNVPMVLYFDQPISGVGMQLGCLTGCSPSLTATISLYDCNGILRGQGSKTPAADFGAGLQVLDTTGTTTMVVVDYGATTVPEAIDDLAFQLSTAGCTASASPKVKITSHKHNDVVAGSPIFLEGTVEDAARITQFKINGQAARLTPKTAITPASPVYKPTFSFRHQQSLTPGSNPITARAVNAAGKRGSQSLTVHLGAPATVTLPEFHLTQRGIMLTDLCDVDDPFVAGKFTIVRIELDARTSSGAPTYVDTVKMNLYRQVGTTDQLVDTVWGSTLSPYVSSFHSPSQMAGIHFWIPGDKVATPGKYSFRFQAYVGTTPVGGLLEIPCTQKRYDFSATKPVKLLILPVEAPLFSSELPASDRNNVLKALLTVARTFPVKEGVSMIGDSRDTGMEYVYCAPHLLCDGSTAMKDASNYCDGTGYTWTFLDTHPAGLSASNHMAVTQAGASDCTSSSVVGGRMVNGTLFNLPRTTRFGLFTPGTPPQFGLRRYVWPMDDNHNGNINDDLANYVLQHRPSPTAAWSNNMGTYMAGNTFRGYVDSNNDGCWQRTEPAAPSAQRWLNVERRLLWQPQDRARRAYNRTRASSSFHADFGTLWFSEAFHPKNNNFNMFGPGSGQLNGSMNWVTAGNDNTLSHELGHNHNLSHVNGAVPAWQAYAYYQSIPFMNAWSNMNSFVLAPERAFFTSAHYSTLHGKLKITGSSKRRAFKADEDRLTVAGVLDLEGGTLFLDTDVSQGAEISQPDAESDFRIWVGNAAEVLVDHPFPVREPTDVDDYSGLNFEVTVPFSSSAEWAAILVGEEVIWYAERSPNAPVVEVITPVGGEAFDAAEDVTVEWAADDLDGDPLVFDVLYSPDGNQWHPLAVGLSGTSYTWNTDAMPGGQEGLVRVIASDGFNRGEDVNDDVFTVAGKEPVGFIFSPTSGSSFLQGQQISLRAEALDPEGIPLTLTWRLDGAVVGSGRDLLLDPVSPGAHVIELSIVDADGFNLDLSTGFTVEADSDRDGMADVYEEAHGLEPSLAADAQWDLDEDGLVSFDESWRGLDPNQADSDGDGHDDGAEVAAGSDPLDPASIPQN